MVTRVISSSITGVEGVCVDVEAFIARGIPAFDIVGLASASIKESKDRVRAALITSGYRMPPARITVNLSPADIKKEGTAFDLPIAIYFAELLYKPSIKLRIAMYWQILIPCFLYLSCP